jgi:hypothetical protein
MEAVGATGISSPSTISISLKTAVNTKNIHEMQITKDGKKLPINTSSNNNQSKNISKFRCIECGVVCKNITAVINHLDNIHRKKARFNGEYYEIIAVLPPKPQVNCPKCKYLFKDGNSLRGHLDKSHWLKSTFSNGVLTSTTNKITGEKEIYSFTNNIQAINIKESTPKSQDNTNATNTTTNNMDSNRKRSHSLDGYNEASNAKKAMLNPSESGHPQSSDTLSSISNSCEEDSTFGDNFLESITADDSFVTPTAGNIDSINTDFQLSATSQNIDDDKELLELALELAENNSDFQYALEKDVSDKYATSRDFY